LIRSTLAHLRAPRRRPASRLLAALALVALACGVAACGSSGTTATQAGASTGGSNDQGRVQLAACLRKNGVNVPDPGAGGGGPGAFGGNVDRTKVRQLLQGACKKYAQNAFGNVTAADRQQFRQRLVKFASCLRSKGLNVADPSPSGGPGQGGGFLRQLNRSDPKVQAALTACQSQLPQRPGGGPGGPGGPPPGGAPAQ
jgi:hypothetical protein